jgi:uncharacterized membrane protein YcaP (DUF421 family)
MESAIVYILRCLAMLIITWTAIRVMGKKSISEMTGHDLAAIILLTTVGAEPLVYKTASKASVGVFTLSIGALLISALSLKNFFYNIDTNPVILVSNQKILKENLKKVRMNIPILMSELRVLGYQNLSDIRYAVLEPNGKISVIPDSKSSPPSAKDLGVPTATVNLSFFLIVDGKVVEENLKYLEKDRDWLTKQLKKYNIKSFDEVLIAQYDSSGNIFVNKKEVNINNPNLL